MKHTNERKTLVEAVKAIMLLEWRKQITRDERNARLGALWATPAGQLFTGAQCERIAKEAVDAVMEMMDEVHFSQSGRWQ